MLVEMENLRVAFSTPSGWNQAVRGVSLTLGAEKLGIVGESGSGKSLTARAILRLLPHQAQLTADRLAFDGINVMTANERTLRRIRGRCERVKIRGPMIIAKIGPMPNMITGLRNSR